MEDFPEFKYNDVRRVGATTIYYGASPVDLVDRDIKGRKFIVDGEPREAVSLESFAKLSGPITGEYIGIVFS